MSRYTRVRVSDAACLVVAIMLSMTGCGTRGPQRGAIQGSVTIGGQPLSAGRILFLPQPPTTGPATSISILNGEYGADRTAGPVVGNHRVEIEAALDLGFPIDDDEAFVQKGRRRLPSQSIPPEFNRDSRLTAEIVGGEANRYDVTIPAIVQSARN